MSAIIDEKPAFDWKNPDYLAIFAQRAQFLQDIRTGKVKLAKLKRYYKENPADFINDFGMTVDPRNIERGLPAVVPFILFPRQREWVDFVMRKWRGSEPGITKKSRDMGISWLATSLANTMCLFYDDLAIGFGSATEIKIDRLGDPDCLFYKARMFMEYLPEEFKGDWNPDKHAPFMRLKFPGTGSTITGEAGDNIGRGGRKAQKITTPVLTPTGWRTMGSLQVGDYVIGVDGRPVKIVATHPQGVVPLYRVKFDDGVSTDCCGDHLWYVVTKHQRKNKARRRTSDDSTYVGRKKPLFSVMSTRELLDLGITVHRPDNQVEYRYQIPLCESVQYSGKNLPIHPYLLGVLLGDGGITQNIAMLTSVDVELVDRVKRHLPDGMRLVKAPGKYAWRFATQHGRGGKGVKSLLRSSLEALGLYGKGSADKFIPEIYLRGSVEQRIELLRGLIDTDGWISSRGNNGSRVGFLSTSHQLLDNVVELVQSLGGVAGYSWKKGAMMSYPNGHKKWFDGCFELRISTPMNPAYLSRKAINWKPRQKYALARSIVDIQPIEPAEAKCITVDNEDGLYLTNDHIVTHNSIYFVDEAAHLERPKIIDASLSNTTNCRQDLSSVNGTANTFYEKCISGNIEVFEFHWRQDPRKDQAWYDKKVLELNDPVVVAQEIDMDFSAAVEGVLIPSAWAQAAVDSHIRLGIDTTGVRRGALDVADQGKDKNSFGARNGCVLVKLQNWTGKMSDIYATTERAFMLCDEWQLEGFDADADGLGAGVRGDARKINEGRKAAKRKTLEVGMFRGSGGVIDPEREMVPGRKNKDFFQNYKAQSWWSLARRFEQTYRAVNGLPHDPNAILSISSKIPELNRLLAELSQPTWDTTGTGKVQICKAPEGTPSPNMADMVNILYAPRRPPMRIAKNALNRMRYSR